MFIPVTAISKTVCAFQSDIKKLKQKIPMPPTKKKSGRQFKRVILIRIIGNYKNVFSAF